MIPNEPLIFRNIITEDERVQLKNYALSLLQEGDLKINSATAGNYRNFKSFFSVEELIPIHKEIYYRVIDIIDLKNPVIDPLLGLIISVIHPGGFIHKHTDKYEDSPLKQFSNHLNLRFNIMIERDDHISYNPCIDDKEYIVNKRDAWFFSASGIPHNTPIISGTEKRIVYQFGFKIDPFYAN